MLSNRTARAGAALAIVMCLAAGCDEEPKVPGEAHLKAGNAFLAKLEPAKACAAYEKAKAAGSRAQADFGLGVCHELQGELKAAERHFRSALQASPEALDVHFGLARVLALGRKPEAAWRHVEQVVGQAPDRVEPRLVMAALAKTPEQVKKALSALQDWRNRVLATAAGSAAGAELHYALARLHEQGDAPHAARAQLRLAESSRLANVVGALGLAEIHRRRGDALAAQRLYGAVVEQAPEHLPARRKWVESALSAGDVKTARRAAQRLPDGEKADDDSLLTRARLALADRRPGDAVMALRRVVDRLSESAPGAARLSDLRLWLAEAMLAADDAEGAIDALEALTRAEPELWKARWLLAELRIRRGQPDAAIEALEASLKRKPDAAKAYLLLADAHRAKGAAAAVEQTYRRMMKAVPSYPRAPLLLGHALRERGETQQAKQAYEQALVLAPGWPEPVQALVWLAKQAGHLDQAEQRVRSELEAHRESVPLLHVLAGVQLERGQPDAAEKTYRKALAADGRGVRGWHALASFYARTERRGDAIRACDQALKRDPRHVRSLLLLGQLRAEAGQVEQARDAYERALAAQPGHVVALNNLAMLHADAEGVKDLDRALRLAEQAHTKAPDVPGVRDTLGWVLHRRGEHDRAVSLLQAAAKQRESPQVRYHLGMALLATGREAEGKRALREALSMSEGFADAEQARAALAGTKK